MKNIVLLILLIFVFFSCKDNETFFDASISRENIRFEPIPGGAVMHYALPEDTDIFAVRAVYDDYKGEKMIKIASYAYDSLVLDGFNEARNGVPVKISLLNQNNEESKVMEMTFDTENSSAVAFFEHIEVLPYWDGFQVKYEVPVGATGLCNIFFLGTNPVTQELDTLLLETFSIVSGKNVKYFNLAQVREANTVVIKTEDIRGNVAKQKVYEGIICYMTEKLESSGFEWLDPFGLSIEDDNPDYRLGWKYLFDGDVKGTQKFELAMLTGADYYDMYTFMAGPFAVNTPDDPKYFILDIKEAKLVARFQMYALLYGLPSFEPSYFASQYINDLPNWVTVYASNNKDDEDSWVEIGNFYESPNVAVPWAQRTLDFDDEYCIRTVEDLNASDPCYFKIQFSEENPPYRYFKIEFNGVFKEVKGWTWAANQEEYVTLHELEVYVKQE